VRWENRTVGKPDQPRNPDGTWRKRGGGIFIAGVVALGAAFGVGSGTFGASSGATAGSGGSSISSGSGSAQTARGTRGKARDRSSASAVQRLTRSGLKVRERQTDARSDCAAHSYGQVEVFFRAHPCEALFRTLLEVRDGRGAVALVAVAWVDMPDAEQARQLKALMDRPGTGNITELSREGGGRRFTGHYYVSNRGTAGRRRKPGCSCRWPTAAPRRWCGCQ
jgi:hypothetical protein